MSSTHVPAYSDLVHAVVEAVAEAENTDPTDLDPLYWAVDPDSLNDLFDGKGGTGGRVEFEYCGYDVTAHSDGRVTLSGRGGP